MARFTLFIALFITASITFIACGDSSTSTTENGTTEQQQAENAAGQMAAKVDGQAWQATKAQADYIDGTLIITGTGADQSKLVLEIGEKPVIGIFPIKRGKLQAASYEQTTEGGTKYYAPFDGSTGVVNITAISDDEVAGNFSFSGSNFSKHVLIEDGTFVAPIITKKPVL